MDMTLYKIGEEIGKILGSEEWGDDQEKALAELEMALEVKADNIVGFCAKLESFSTMCKAEEERIAAKRKAVENRAASLRKYLLANMKAVGRSEIQAGTHTLKIQKNPPAVKVDSEADIPAKYWIVIPAVTQLDKKTLGADLKNGEIAGAHLEQSERLVVK
jgi:hypothetical protein